MPFLIHLRSDSHNARKPTFDPQQCPKIALAQFLLLLLLFYCYFYYYSLLSTLSGFFQRALQMIFLEKSVQFAQFSE